MKTSTNEVTCDACGDVIPLILTQNPSLSLTLRGQSVGHKKADLCDVSCLAWWAAKFAAQNPSQTPALEGLSE